MPHMSAMVALILTCALATAAASSDDIPPASPKEQAEELMNEGIAFAERMLREHGEFFPFGVVRKADGSIQLVGASDGQEQPPSQALINLLNQGFRKGAQAGDYTATAIFYDVLITPPGSPAKSDAVQVGLEHRSGYCVNVFFPYQRSSDGTVQFGELFAGRREATVFRCK